jgi:hypothetical protein
MLKEFWHGIQDTFVHEIYIVFYGYQHHDTVNIVSKVFWGGLVLDFDLHFNENRCHYEDLMSSVP